MSMPVVESQPVAIVFARIIGMTTSPYFYRSAFSTDVTTPGELGEFTVMNERESVRVKVSLVMYQNTRMLVFDRLVSSHPSSSLRTAVGMRGTEKECVVLSPRQGSEWTTMQVDLLTRHSAITESLHSLDLSLQKQSAFLSSPSSSSMPYANTMADPSILLSIQCIHADTCVTSNPHRYRVTVQINQQYFSTFETEGVVGALTQRLILPPTAIVHFHVQRQTSPGVWTAGLGVLHLASFTTTANTATSLQTVCIPCFTQEGYWLCQLRVVLSSSPHSDLAALLYERLQMEAMERELTEVLDRASTEYRRLRGMRDSIVMEYYFVSALRGHGGQPHSIHPSSQPPQSSSSTNITSSSSFTRDATSSSSLMSLLESLHDPDPNVSNPLATASTSREEERVGRETNPSDYGQFSSSMSPSAIRQQELLEWRKIESDCHFAVILHALCHLPGLFTHTSGLYALVTVGNTTLRTPVYTNAFPDPGPNPSNLPLISLFVHHSHPDFDLMAVQENGVSVLVVSSLSRQSLAFATGLRIGYQLLSMNGQPAPTSVESFENDLRQSNGRNTLVFGIPSDVSSSSSFFQITFDQELLFPAGITLGETHFSLQVYEETDMLEDLLVFSHSLPISRGYDSQQSERVGDGYELWYETCWKQSEVLDKEVVMLNLQLDISGIGLSMVDRAPRELAYLSVNAVKGGLAMVETGKVICEVKVRVCDVVVIGLTVDGIG